MAEGFKISLVQALKLSTICLGVIAITVGHFGHYGAQLNLQGPGRGLIVSVSLRAKMTEPAYEVECKLNAKMDKENPCPTGTMVAEQIFLALIPIFLVLSMINFILSALFDMDKKILKFVDMGFQLLAGLLVIVGGILMLSSSIRIDAHLGTGLKMNIKDTFKDQKVNTTYGDPIFVGFEGSTNPLELHPPTDTDLAYFSCKESSLHFPVKYRPTTTTPAPYPNPNLNPNPNPKTKLGPKPYQNTPIFAIASANIYFTVKEMASKQYKNLEEGKVHSALMTDIRKQLKFHEKNSAGAIAIIGGIFHVLAAVFILLKKGAPGQEVSGGAYGYPPPPMEQAPPTLEPSVNPIGSDVNAPRTSQEPVPS